MEYKQTLCGAPFEKYGVTILHLLSLLPDWLVARMEKSPHFVFRTHLARQLFPIIWVSSGYRHQFRAFQNEDLDPWLLS